MGNNPLSYTDPTGNILETAINAGDRASGVFTGVKPIGEGIECIFGSIASVFHALDNIDIENESIVGVDIDLKSCFATAVSKNFAGPFFSDTPVEDATKKGVITGSTS